MRFIIFLCFILLFFGFIFPAVVILALVIAGGLSIFTLLAKNKKYNKSAPQEDKEYPQERRTEYAGETEEIEEITEIVDLPETALH